MEAFLRGNMKPNWMILLCGALLLAAGTVGTARAEDEWFGDEKPQYVPREKLVLFDIDAPGLEYTEQITVNYFVKRELSALAYYDILADAELMKVLDVGRVPQCSDEDCRMRVAKAAGATEYIYGDVSGDAEDAEIRLVRMRIADNQVIGKQEFEWSGKAISLPWLTSYLAIQLFLPKAALVDGQLQLQVEPKAADVSADGSEVKVPSDNTIRLEAGIHEVEITRRGYESQTLPVVIVPKRVVFQRVQLELK